MNNRFTFLVIGLFFGFGAGFLTSMYSRAAATDTAAHAASNHKSHEHRDHEKLVEAGEPAPTLALEISPDGPNSRNLHILTTNFTFDPVAANKPRKQGHGHAHVYVNGLKTARAYGPWIHLDNLPSGVSEIRVTLNANDHSLLAVSGKPVEVVAKVAAK